MFDRKLQAPSRRIGRALLGSLLLLAVTCAPGQPPAVSKSTVDPNPGPPLNSGATPLATSPLSAATAVEIQRINERMTLLQAQLNELELQAKIGAKRKEVQSAALSTGAASALESRAGLPSVQSVSGVKGRLEAVLVFAGGLTQRVKAGDVVDGRRVVRISLNEVLLADLPGRKVQRLAFGSAPLVRESTSTSAPSSPLPLTLFPAVGR